MSERDHAHELIDRLPEAQLSALVGLLETIVDPVATALRNAPDDDEPETQGEKRAISEARDWLAKTGGKGIPHNDAYAPPGTRVKRSSGPRRRSKTWRSSKEALPAESNKPSSGSPERVPAA